MKYILPTIRKEYQIFYNSKVKCYPDGSFKQTVASRPVFKESGWEPASDVMSIKIPKPKDMTNESRDDSIRRAKNKVEDIIRLNDFDYFITLTFDQKKINSFSPKEVLNKVKAFFSNHVQRHGAIYVLIPEHHKKGAIHLHGFIKGDFKLSDSGTVKVKGHKPIKPKTAERLGISKEQWQTVYNLSQWSYGFSTAVKIPDSERAYVSKYITKYITKDVEKIFGKFYLAGGNGLKRETDIVLTDVPYDTFDSQGESYCRETNTYFKYYDSMKSVPEQEVDFNDLF